MRAIVLVILGGLATEARADGCLTTTGPEPAHPVRLAVDSLPVDGAVVLIDAFPLEGAPIVGTLVPDEEVVSVGTGAELRILRTEQDLIPGAHSVLLDGNSVGMVIVVDETSTEPPALVLAPAIVGEVEEEPFGCEGVIREGRWITLVDGGTSFTGDDIPIVLLYVLDGPDAPLPEDPTWAVERWPELGFTVWEPPDHPVGPCFAGRWLGQTGDLGPMSEVVCAEPVVGCGCATGAQPGSLGLLVILLGRRRLR